MRILSCIRWSIVAAVLALLLAPAAVALTTGTQLVVVDGKSMTPTYDYGDIVLIGPPTEADFAPGHVVTVGLSSGAMYTHRVVSVTDGKAQLKGDGNAAEDPDLVTFDQLVGAVRGHIGSPLADVLAYAQTLPARISLAVLVLAFILLPLGRARGTDAGIDEAAPTAAPRDSEESESREAIQLSDSLAVFAPLTTDASSTPPPAPNPAATAPRKSVQQW